VQQLPGASGRVVRLHGRFHGAGGRIQRRRIKIRHFRFAVEQHLLRLAGEKVAPGGLEPDGYGAQRDGAVAERVGQPQPDRLAPEVGLDNEPEGLIDGPVGVAARKGAAFFDGGFGEISARLEERPA
jgi:hypothetical protein